MKEYVVNINGVDHTLQLDADGVKQYPDAKPVETKQAPEPANKSRTASNKKA